eukprot:jgi/Botrbrau1/14600/Bobra.242_2s0010.1
MAILALQSIVPFLLALAITGGHSVNSVAPGPSSTDDLPTAKNGTLGSASPTASPSTSNRTYVWNATLSSAIKTPTPYEKPQDPYKSTVGKVLRNKEVCGPINDTQAQLLWNAAGQVGTAPTNFSNLLTTIVNTTVWAYPLLSVVSAAAPLMGNAAAFAPPPKLATVYLGTPSRHQHLVGSQHSCKPHIRPRAYPLLSVVSAAAPLMGNAAALRLPPKLATVYLGTPSRHQHLVGSQHSCNHTSDSVVAPNSDTLYSVGFLDLSGGPLLVNIPEYKGPYFGVQALDAYTNVPIIIDSLNTPSGGRFVFALENYTGPPIPKDLKVLYFPTPLVWIIQRIFATNNATDLAAAQTFLQNTTFTPLFPDNYTLPTAQTNLVREALHGVFNPTLPGEGNVSVWWGLLANATELNPPITPAEQKILDTYLATTGVSKNGSNIAGLPPATKLALNLGLAAGLQCIEWHSLDNPQYRVSSSTGWSAPVGIVKVDDTVGPNKNRTLVGGFYTDLNLRSVVARIGLGANAPKTAVYYTPQFAVSDPSKPVTEETKLPLDGSKYNYTLTFPTFPNVSGFWSLTVYKNESILFFGDTPYNKANGTYRYNINEATPGVDFKGGKDFTLYLSATPPPEGSAVYKNWIPIGNVPDSKFIAYLRYYGPEAAAENGTYAPPALVAHKGTWGEPRTSTI